MIQVLNFRPGYLKNILEWNFFSRETGKTTSNTSEKFLSLAKFVAQIHTRENCTLKYFHFRVSVYFVGWGEKKLIIYKCKIQTRFHVAHLICYLWDVSGRGRVRWMRGGGCGGCAWHFHLSPPRRSEPRIVASTPYLQLVTANTIVRISHQPFSANQWNMCQMFWVFQLLLHDYSIEILVIYNVLKTIERVVII